MTLKNRVLYYMYMQQHITVTVPQHLKEEELSINMLMALKELPLFRSLYDNYNILVIGTDKSLYK